MPYVECRYAANSHACYKKHSHPTFSLGAVESGQSRFSYSQAHCNQTETIGPGTIVPVMPDSIHACNPLENQQWSYHMFYIDSEWLEDLRGQITDTRQGKKIRLQGLSRTLYQPSLYRQIVRVNRLMLSDDPVLEKETRLISLMAQLMNTQNNEPERAPPLNHPAVSRVQEFLDTHACETITLDQLAQEAEISSYHLIRLFKHHTGFTPHAFQIDRRINQSKKLLKCSNSIADVALKTGFSDQAHFQRSFKQYTALTPAQYQQTSKKI
ncbi:hypothetical protein BGP75_13555 [Motiliproteus sp. MSK22-1]|nr:hypothetical protein BGP75_13555 [Motiliproteus sp. MSK22-1]